jgi:peptidoglycan hydrolase-like amidase
MVIVTSALLATIPAEADSAAEARSASFTISGAGWGHGWGMSQYGAYGAARKGLSWKQILAFYYRGTQLSVMPAGTRIKGLDHRGQRQQPAGPAGEWAHGQ